MSQKSAENMTEYLNRSRQILTALTTCVVCGYVVVVFSPPISTFPTNSVEALVWSLAKLLALVIGGLVGWGLGGHFNRIDDRHARMQAIASLILMVVLQLVSFSLFITGYLPQARVLAVGGVLSGIGIKLLALVLVPIAKAIPTGIGAGAGGYIFKRLVDLRKGQTRGKPSE